MGKERNGTENAFPVPERFLSFGSRSFCSGTNFRFPFPFRSFRSRERQERERKEREPACVPDFLNIQNFSKTKIHRQILVNIGIGKYRSNEHQFYKHIQLIVAKIIS